MLRIDAVAAPAILAVPVLLLVSRAPRNQKPSAIKRGHRRSVLATVDKGVHPELSTDRVAIGSIELSIYVIARAATVGTARIISPAHNKTAASKRRNRWFILTARDIGVHTKLCPHRNTRGAVNLPTNISAAASIVTTVISPAHNKPSVAKPYHRRIVLLSRCVGVHSELITRRSSIGPIALGVDAIVTAILAVRRPADHKTAARERGHRRQVLGAALVGVDPKLCPYSGTAGIVALPPYVGTAASIMATVISPAHNKAITGKHRHRRFILGTARIGVDPKLCPHSRTIGIVALPPNVSTAATIMTTVIPPTHNKTTTGKRRHRRVVLAARCIRVDPKLLPNRRTILRINLAPHIPATAPIVTA